MQAIPWEPTEPNKFLLKMYTTAQNRFRLIHTSIFNELRVYLKDFLLEFPNIGNFGDEYEF